MKIETGREKVDFRIKDYDWREELKKRLRPECGYRDKSPFGESPLLEQKEISFAVDDDEDRGLTRISYLDNDYRQMIIEFMHASPYYEENWECIMDSFEVGKGRRPMSESKDFDRDARERMVYGSRWLKPLLINSLNGKKGKLLEIGPFTSPLVTPSDDFPDIDISYMDNEQEALDILSKKYPKVNLINCDISKLGQIEKLGYFDFMVMSQIFNYVDFRKLLQASMQILSSGGLIFINNVAHYGIPEYFAPEGVRPNNEWDTMQSLQNIGFIVDEWVVVPSHDVRLQPLDRLLVVARKT